MSKNTTYAVGICVRYDDGVYTLAAVRFGSNRDIVIWPPVGNRGKAGKRKWNPHNTYHGSAGMQHAVSYGQHLHEKVAQIVNSSFTGRVCLSIQAFGHDDARRWDKKCSGFNSSIVIESRDIRDKVDRIEDHLGKVETQLPTTFFQVDLIEPGRLDLVNSVVAYDKRIIAQELIKATFPWCVITVFD